MRPLRLRLQAFAAYGDAQEIDFGRLGEHRLFLIHGPTGAGKTSVLDGLCYALFGESSGADREARHLRSHHAPPGLPTLVEYDFALGGARYRVRRSPAWERPKLRGAGTVTVPGEVALWRLGEDGNAPALLAEGEGRVRAALEALLGYKAAEFRQVVLLPQGRFRELLTAKPGDRQAILATLFRTALYRRIQDALAEQARAATQEVRRIEERRRVLLGQAGAETAEAAAAARAALAAEAEQAEARQAAAETAARAAQAALEAGRSAAARLARLAEAESARAALEAKAPAVAAD
ncbi:AAA family ATPase, partial [Caldovatus aquaticus]